MREITLEEANLILRGAVAKAREMGVKPLTLTVVDRSGHIKAVMREDGASMFRFDVALGKAYAAIAMGASSRKLGESAKNNPNFFVALAATAQGKFLPQTGAVLIGASSEEVIGAIGASGASGDEDEAACIAGVQAAGLVAM